MARRLWPGQDAVGQRFKMAPQTSEAPWFTVVGIVGDMRRQGLENNTVAQMFEPVAQNPSRLATLLVRTSIKEFRSAWRARCGLRGILQVDKRGLVYSVSTVAARLNEFQAERRFQSSLLMAFSAVALLLAAIGIYGVVQYSIATRTREIGIRMAVGAERKDIFTMILSEGLKLQRSWSRARDSSGRWDSRTSDRACFWAFRPWDPTTYVIVSLLLTAVATAGCFFPARRAAGVNPLVALKYE